MVGWGIWARLVALVSGLILERRCLVVGMVVAVADMAVDVVLRGTGRVEWVEHQSKFVGGISLQSSYLCGLDCFLAVMA